MTTQCQCDTPGHCRLLRRECDPPEGRLMSEVRHNECRNKPHYFEMFLKETSKPCRQSKILETDWNQPTRCRHLGEQIETRICYMCGNKKGTEYPVRECAIHGVCSERKRDSQVECCLGCEEYEPSPLITPSTELPSTGLRWAVGITTAPRTRHYTLAECVESVLVNGWEPIIYAEPGSKFDDVSLRETGQQIVQRRERLGLWRNWKSAARDLLDRFPEADFILTIQDDTVFHPQARWFAEHYFDPTLPRVYSLYTPKHYGLLADVIDGNGVVRQVRKPYQSAMRWITKQRRRKGWYIKSYPKSVGLHKINTHSLWGACAMVFPRAVLAEILSHRIAKTWLGHRGKMSATKWKARQTREPWRIQNSDTAIGKIISNIGAAYYCAVPSLAEHIAKASADGVNHGGNGGRRNAGWFAAGDLREIFSFPLRDQI